MEEKKSVKITFLFVAHFLVLFSRSSIYANLPLSLLNYKNSSLFIVGITFAIPYLTQATTLFYYGRYLDKARSWRRYQLLTLIGYIAMLVQFILFSIFNKINPDALLFLLISLGASLFFTACMLVIKKFVSLLTRTSRQGSVLSTLSAIETLSFASGTLIGGFIYDAIGIGSIFIIGVIFSLISVLIIITCKPFTIVDDKLMVVADAPVNNSSMRFAGVRTFKKRMTLKKLIIFILMLNVSIGIFFPFYSPFIISIGGNATLIGLSHAIACFAAVFVVKALGWIADNKNAFIPLLYGNIGYLVLFTIFLLTTNPIIIILSWSFPLFVYFVGASYIVTQITSPRARGRAFSLTIISQLSGIATGAIIGALISIWKSYELLLLSGAIGLGITLLFLLSIIIPRNTRKSIVNEYQQE
ncbi:MAG: MFS transporter [Promethearchaeota archaeon]